MSNNNNINNNDNFYYFYIIWFVLCEMAVYNIILVTGFTS